MSTGSAVLVVDGTGRGHAICDLFARTEPGLTVYYGPGCRALRHNRIVSVPAISLSDPGTALAFLDEHKVEFVFVSHIDALTNGYVDALRAAGHEVIGPSAAAARLEASKARGKQFCARYGLATAKFGYFTDAETARHYTRSLSEPCVVKANGLTPNGDGAVVCDTVQEAVAAIDNLAARLGDDFDAVVEERLGGTEISIFALLDRNGYLAFPTALDFKRTLDGDRGINCDGMGSISPHPAADPALIERIRTELLDPMLHGLQHDGLDFTGFIYLGAMITAQGLKVLEINTRFGDSEAQAVLPGVVSNFAELCRAVLAGKIASRELITDGLSRCTVAVVQGCVDAEDPNALPGWPFGDFVTGEPISGLDAVPNVFLANVAVAADGSPVTNGGRIVHVVGAGTTAEVARENAYANVDQITFRGKRFRTDIGARVGALKQKDGGYEHVDSTGTPRVDGQVLFAVVPGNVLEV